jgi:hypothetical protein
VPGLRTNPLLHARVSDDGERIIWPVVEENRWNTVKQFLKGREVEITIGPKRKKRSGRQHRYYFGVICKALQEAAGYTTAEEAHEVLKAHLLVEHHDQGPPTVRSTKALTTAEAEEYYERCRQVIAEWTGEYVPLPNEIPEE